MTIPLYGFYFDLYIPPHPKRKQLAIGSSVKTTEKLFESVPCIILILQLEEILLLKNFGLFFPSNLFTQAWCQPGFNNSSQWKIMPPSANRSSL